MPKKSKTIKTEPAKNAVWISGALIAAITMLLSGIFYVLAYTHDGNIHWDDTFGLITMWAYKIGGICLLAVAAYGLKEKIYPESVAFMIYAIFMLIVAFSYDYENISENAMMAVDLTLGVLLLIPAIVLLLKKQFIFSIAIIVYALANILTELPIEPTDCVIYGIFSIIAGVIFAYIAIACLINAETGYKLPAA